MFVGLLAFKKILAYISLGRAQGFDGELRDTVMYSKSVSDLIVFLMRSHTICQNFMHLQVHDPNNASVLSFCGAFLVLK